MATIVAADDDPDILHLIDLKLRNEGHHVVLATDGEDAVSKIADHAPDIVLLDLSMPRMSGSQVLTALRADAITRSTPVIVITAYTDSARVAQCTELGISGYLAKPFSPQALADRVAAVLEHDRGLPEPTTLRSPGCWGNQGVG